jgi:hypothetical protein
MVLLIMAVMMMMIMAVVVMMIVSITRVLVAMVVRHFGVMSVAAGVYGLDDERFAGLKIDEPSL